jgi:hypothetical protein
LLAIGVGQLRRELGRGRRRCTLHIPELRPEIGECDGGGERVGWKALSSRCNMTGIPAACSSSRGVMAGWGDPIDDAPTTH